MDIYNHAQHPAAELVFFPRRDGKQEPVPRIQPDRLLPAPRPPLVQDQRDAAPGSIGLQVRDRACPHPAVRTRGPVDQDLVVDAAQEPLTGTSAEDLLSLQGKLSQRELVGTRRRPGARDLFRPFPIDRGPIEGGRGRHVFRALHPSFDLEGGDAEGHEVRTQFWGVVYPPTTMILKLGAKKPDDPNAPPPLELKPVPPVPDPVTFVRKVQ